MNKKLELIENKCKNLQKIINSFSKKNPEKAEKYQLLLDKIFEKIKNKKNIKYTLFPKNKKQLQQMIKDEIKKQGNNANLNHIDVSEIDDMIELFKNSTFNGDISEWDVSEVQSMSNMFENSLFNQDISKWQVGKVEYMDYMFAGSEFNQDISNWDVGKVVIAEYMFYFSKFNQDISQWNIENFRNLHSMFRNSEFNQDLNNWESIMISLFNDPYTIIDVGYMFNNSPLENNPPKWYKYIQEKKN